MRKKPTLNELKFRRNLLKKHIEGLSLRIDGCKLKIKELEESIDRDFMALEHIDKRIENFEKEG